MTDIIKGRANTPSLNLYFVCFSAVTQADEKSRSEAVSLVSAHFKGLIIAIVMR